MGELSNILYIDDDLSIQKVALLALQKLGGYQVHVFDSGRSAVIAAQNLEIDLILLDVLMPDLDGFETLAELRKLENFHQTPVIFMSGKSSEQDLLKFKQYGAIGSVAKPFNPMELSQKITEIYYSRK
jgi:DNA-binding response OmpR family regulator